MAPPHSHFGNRFLPARQALHSSTIALISNRTRLRLENAVTPFRIITNPFPNRTFLHTVRILPETVGAISLPAVAGNRTFLHTLLSGVLRPPESWWRGRPPILRRRPLHTGGREGISRGLRPPISWRNPLRKGRLPSPTSAAPFAAPSSLCARVFRISASPPTCIVIPDPRSSLFSCGSYLTSNRT